MLNWLAGGSGVYVPTTDMLMELSLAVHDAGYAKDGEGLIGSLTICTKFDFNDGRLASGITRQSSGDFVICF